MRSPDRKGQEENTEGGLSRQYYSTSVVCKSPKKINLQTLSVGKKTCSRTESDALRE